MRAYRLYDLRQVTASQVYAYAHQFYLEDDRRCGASHIGDNVWGCDRCREAGIIPAESFSAILLLEERGYPVNGVSEEVFTATLEIEREYYPVNGVSTPLTAADCNPHEPSRFDRAEWMYQRAKQRELELIHHQAITWLSQPVEVQTDNPDATMEGDREEEA